MRRTLFVLIAALVVSVMLIGCAAQPTAAPAPTVAPQAARAIKVGIVDTYSGPPAAYGNDALNGFKLALAEINKEGVLGAKIEFVTRDDKFAPDTGLSMAKELVLQEKVDILAGTVNSAASLAISAYALENKVPFIVWTAKSDKVTGEKGHRYAFMTSENAVMAGFAGAQALAKKPYTKFWIAGEDYEYGHSIADATWNSLKKIKPEVQLMGQTWWKTGEPDLVPYLTQVSSAKPDMVIFATGGSGMTNVLKVAKSTGFSDKIPMWIHTAIDYGVLKPLGANGPEGVFGTMDYFFYYPDTPANKAFVKAYQDAYNNAYPSFASFHAYTTAKLIAAAYKKAGALDKEKFIDAMEGLQIDTPVGQVEMRACDHQLVLPIFFGVTKKEAQNEFLTATDIIAVAGKDVMPACADIQKLRGK
ncbi:MAG: ABC transporter substrate-binding protein [Chloroflexi bacterium]|nr:ABC transporter substrate-binding protein [Chloroflexota bacterium]